MGDLAHFREFLLQLLNLCAVLVLDREDLLLLFVRQAEFTPPSRQRPLGRRAFVLAVEAASDDEDREYQAQQKPRSNHSSALSKKRQW